MITVKPTNTRTKCQLPSGFIIDDTQEVEKTGEIARALRFNDLVQVEPSTTINITPSADVVDDTEIEEE